MSQPTVGAAVGSAPLPPGFVQFYDGVRPSLAAGSYRLTATQSIDGLATGSYFAPHTQDFTVDAPRFALEPGDLGELYPPADSAGDFGATLPSIVLNRRTLPWERPQPGGDPALPWVALLTFRPGEAVPDPTTGKALRVSTVADFVAGGQPGVLVPAIDRGSIPPELMQSTMTSVVVPRELFAALAPTAEEAKLLAHVRHTDTSAQATADSTHDGWYSVVVGNRFPATGAAADGTALANLACLVSLEGLTGYLPGGTGAPPPAAGQQLRLAVLASWTFTANPAGGGEFAQLLTSLLPTPMPNADALLLRVPVPSSAPASTAATRLREGYVPMDYQLPTGEQTFAWYRGPFTPAPALPLPAPADGSAHHSTASEVTIYAQDEGVFDVSYAAAFEAGRLAALADRGFAVALLTARQAAYHTVGTVQARMNSPIFAPAAAGTSTAAPALTVAQLAQPRLAGQTLAVRLNGGMGDQLSTALSQLPQAAAQPPPSAGASSASASSAPAGTATGTQTPAPPDPVEQMRALLARADVQELLAALVRGEAMNPVTDWLARLALLHPVPFRHLVPDDRMLPVESLRFFYLDAGWLTALVDGALSIGVQGSRDLELHEAISAPLIAAVAEKVGTVRADLRDRPDLAVQTDAAPKQRAGLLLRSSVVSGWPGLSVQADNGQTALLRLDRLSDSVLLAVFDGVPATVSLGEPWHGLHFGLSSDAALHLRHPDGTELGEPFPAAGQPQLLTAFTRPATSATPASGVLQVSALAAALLARLQALIPAPTTGPLAMGPALFATELLAGSRRLTFRPGGGLLPLPPPPRSNPVPRPNLPAGALS